MTFEFSPEIVAYIVASAATDKATAAAQQIQENILSGVSNIRKQLLVVGLLFVLERRAGFLQIKLTLLTTQFRFIDTFTHFFDLGSLFAVFFLRLCNGSLQGSKIRSLRVAGGSFSRG